MPYLFEIAQPVTLLVTIPESVGLLMFGIALVAIAVLIRSFIGKASAGDAENEKATKKA